MCNVFRRIRSRRGGGGVERGGDPWVALGGGTIPGLGDPRVPTPLHTAPAPTRSRPLPMGFLPNTYPCGRPGGRESHKDPPAGLLFPFITFSIVPRLTGCQIYTACHTCTEPSPLAEAMCLPSGNHTTACTESLCARKVSTLACG